MHSNKLLLGLLICIFLLSLPIVAQHSAAQWKTRTIYQLLTDRFARTDNSSAGCPDIHAYCGGTYRGIINNFDYILGMGFDAIWISPIVLNYRSDYHGYAAMDIYTLNPHFGPEADFVQFISKCHQHDVWVMVDVVANHMGNLDQDFSQNVPFNSKQHFHDFCQISGEDFQSKNQNRIENCRLARLADLKQENPYVQKTLLDWVRNLIVKYRVDGIRIDTVAEVPKWFWSKYQQAAGVYAVGQVFDGDMSYVAGYVGPLNACLNYPFFFSVRDTIFGNKDMLNFRYYYSEWAKRLPTDKLEIMATFVDNHDNPRALSFNGDWQTKKKYSKTANVFILTSIGIPIVYYGTQQFFAGGADPANRQTLWTNLNKESEMYKYLATVVKSRKANKIWEKPQVQRYADNQIFAYSRGKFLVLLTNKVDRTVSKFISYHPFDSGQKICNIFNQADCISVNGGFQISLSNGQAKIYVPKN